METSYDQVLYHGFPYAQSHPDRLATIATLFGMQPAPIDRCRVLELGCGDGGNLLPMAFAFPGSTFLGFDLAETPIAAGREAIAGLRLTNLRLEAADILALPPGLDEFDYIIAHGVYSWVPEAVRDKLLAVAHDHLSPQGVAYVSYNALPGCHIRQMIRDMLLFHLRNVHDADTRIHEALDFLQMLLNAPERVENRTPALLKHEVQGLFERPPEVLFHDELGEIYFPIHFTDFMRHASSHGLQFLAEANIFDVETAKYPAGVRQQLERYSKGERLDREQYMDFLKCRKFRQTLLCRAGITISETPITARVRQLYAASPAAAVSPEPDLTGDRVEEFRGPQGAAAKTAHPLAKAAIGNLAAMWPQTIHFDELLAWCRDRIGEAADPDALAEIMMATYRAGLVELHVHSTGCAARAGEYPETTPLARWQATHGRTITTLRHTTVEATGGVETRLLTLLDGTRDRAALADELERMLDPAPPRATLMVELEANLSKLAKFGLLRLVVLLCAVIVASPVRAAAPDAIYVNGKIVTVDARFSIAQAFAVSGHRFVAVGTGAAIRKLAGPYTRVIDLHKRTVIPGLEDSHLHSAGGGPGVDLSQARSIADVLAAIRERANALGPGALVISNGDWHEAQLKEQRLPLRRDLDTVSPGNPVVLVRGGHEYILNSAALTRWHIDMATQDPAGGQISRYSDGEPNGELVDRARTLVRLPPRPPATLEQRMREALAEYLKLNAAGLTSVRHPGISLDQYRMLQQMETAGLLTMRLNVLVSAPPNADAAKVRSFLENSGVKPGEGDELLRVAGMKLIADGGFEGGWMRDPYAGPYGNHNAYRGLQLMPLDTFTGIVKELNRLGWRVGTHAVGDAAIDEVLTGYEAANAESPIVRKRWTIEHGFLPRDADFARMKSLGVIVTVQNHLYLAGPSLVRYWGLDRAAWVTPVRAYLDHGIPVAAGTDSPVVPYQPLRTIYHFVTRDTITGGVLGAGQKITREEALRISTIGNAYLTFDEKIKGSIEPGKLADFVVLAGDILTVPAKRIENMKVLMTVVGGKTVYTAHVE